MYTLKSNYFTLTCVSSIVYSICYNLYLALDFLERGFL